MSRRNRMNVRGNGADPNEVEASSTESESDYVERPSPRKPTERTLPESSFESRGDDLLGFAHLAARHPVTTLLASFSVGFGLGVLVTAIVPREDRGWWARRHFPHSLRDLRDGLGRIPDQIARHLPDSFARH